MRINESVKKDMTKDYVILRKSFAANCVSYDTITGFSTLLGAESELTRLGFYFKYDKQMWVKTDDKGNVKEIAKVTDMFF